MLLASDEKRQTGETKLLQSGTLPELKRKLNDMAALLLF
ncbi:hypothetical protein HMPREF1249_0382 [Jonquetella sp. BV3C21]|nr:hypothetical protein HMPREF1249_0382 [Jonquetella sp. BV3C21]